VTKTETAAQPADASASPPITAHDLGFETGEDGLSWTKQVGAHLCSFRLLRSLADLVPTEALQREVFGASDLDLVAASELVVVQETGGDVIGAFRQSGEVEELIGLCVGLGGFYLRRPRLVSDFLVVRADMRSIGLGAEMKKLQAALALERGLVEIVWTVDPLRAANARLNLEKLGAYADHYEVNRYGEGFGAGLYGNMPTDRLHMTWKITDLSVRDRLLGRIPPLHTDDIDDLLHFSPERPDADRALVYLPSNIDDLLARDPNAALRWRLTLRETLQFAFAAGYVITGFVPQTDPERGLSSYVLTRRDEGASS
jgi:predicted GNAT superfamily acetyltransferase